MKTKMIKTKEDAIEVIAKLNEGDMIRLYPNGFYGNLQVCFTSTGCREFYNGEFGTVGEDEHEAIVNMLYKYREAYNKQAEN